MTVFRFFAQTMFFFFSELRRISDCPCARAGTPQCSPRSSCMAFQESDIIVRPRKLLNIASIISTVLLIMQQSTRVVEGLTVFPHTSTAFFYLRQKSEKQNAPLHECCAYRSSFRKHCFILDFPLLCALILLFMIYITNSLRERMG